MKMDPGLDTGPILSQRSFPIAAQDTGGALFGKMSSLGADLLLETLPQYLGGALIPVPQPEQGSTYAPMLKKEDGLLDFTHPASALERRVRAMHPWPGAFFEWQGQPLKVHKAHTEFVFTYMIQPAGTRTIYNGLPAIYGSDNIMLVLDEVQPPGKKSMPGKAFIAGAREWISSQDGIDPDKNNTTNS
jgi:methionyl-tRNA formyltransferase